MQPARKLNPAIATLIVIVLIGIVTAIVVVANQSKETATTETAQTSITSGENLSYADGTYTETGSYFSPGGNESIEVTITLANGIITAATVTGNANNSDSRLHQEEFISGYKNLVVGKDVDEVSLSRVAGSSLTSNGFNSALDKIKADAEA